MNDERFFTRLAEKTDAVPGAADRAPARLKSRLYSALVAAQAAAGPLRSLPATKAIFSDASNLARLSRPAGSVMRSV